MTDTNAQRLAWLHSSASNDVAGYEWGIFRVKWNNGQPAEVWQTASDFSDLDAARLATPQPSPLAAPMAEGEATEPDMRAICEVLGFDPTNHHNAARCPYCRPEPAAVQAPEGSHE